MSALALPRRTAHAAENGKVPISAENEARRAGVGQKLGYLLSRLRQANRHKAVSANLAEVYVPKHRAEPAVETNPSYQRQRRQQVAARFETLKFMADPLNAPVPQGKIETATPLGNAAEQRAAEVAYQADPLNAPMPTNRIDESQPTPEFRQTIIDANIRNTSVNSK
jgi:hypothetical protein